MATSMITMTLIMEMGVALTLVFRFRVFGG